MNIDELKRLSLPKDRIEFLKKYLEECKEQGIDISWIGNVIYELHKMGYFSAPAGANHHGNYAGGLFDHSITVASQLVTITNRMGLEWKESRSPLLVGLLHDICKVDQYVVKDFVDDRTLYEFDKHTFYKGHGDKSVMMLASMLKLTNEEVACIRYHMGAFTDSTEWEFYSRAVKAFPNVLWTHTADMLASQCLGI